MIDYESLVTKALKIKLVQKNIKTLRGYLSADKGNVDIITRAFALGVYLRGATLGYVAQALELGQALTVPTVRIESWRRLALEQGDRLSRAAQVRETLSREQAELWATEAARTTARRGLDSGVFGKAEDANVPFKTWVRVAPVRSPRAHSNLEGVTIERDELFTLPSGIQVYGPRDPAAPFATEWIGCQHHLLYSDRRANAVVKTFEGPRIIKD